MEPYIKKFYDSLKDGRIMGEECRTCRHVMLPPLGSCARCCGHDLHWIELSGRGKLLYASVGRHRLMDIEFIQGTIRLEEGPVIPGMVLIDDFDYLHPEKIWEYSLADISVQAEIVENPQGVKSIGFRIKE